MVAAHRSRRSCAGAAAARGDLIGAAAGGVHRRRGERDRRPDDAGAAPATTAARGSAPTAATPPSTASAVATGTVSTDVVRATFDSRGGELLRLELLQHADAVDRKKREVLFDATKDRLYVAQTGLVPAAGGSGLPNHHTPMQVVPGPRELAGGGDALQVRFESAPVGGVRLAKTYTLRRGSYVFDVRHEVRNDSAQPVDPRLYLQLVRDGNPPPGESSLYFTFTVRRCTPTAG